VRRDRKLRRGGGVLIYAASSLHATVSQWEGGGKKTAEEEVLWVQTHDSVNTYFIGVIYHPPNPVYATATLLLSLDRDILAIRTLYSSARIVLSSDLNQLAPENIFEVTDLISAVSAPTKRESHLDHLPVTDTFYSHIKVVKPVLRTDHNYGDRCLHWRSQNQPTQAEACVHVSPTVTHSTRYIPCSPISSRANTF